MAKLDNDDIVNETGKDINEGYRLVEAIDDKTKEISYEVLCDGELMFATVSKPVAFGWIEGHKSGSEGAGGKPDKSDKGANNDKGGSVDPSKVKTPETDKDGNPTKGGSTGSPQAKPAAPKPRRLL